MENVPDIPDSKPEKVPHSKINILSSENQLYYCSQCDYSALQASNLYRHVEAKHDGVLYKCAQCEYTATYRNPILEHIKTKHDGIRFFL